MDVPAADPCIGGHPLVPTNEPASSPMDSAGAGSTVHAAQTVKDQIHPPGLEEYPHGGSTF
jgi:hypothetical protein